MKELDLENYIILTVENGQLQVLYDEHISDLYLYKYGNYYLTRNKASIISSCLYENILLIRQGYKIDINSKPFLKNMCIDGYIIFKRRYPYLYELCVNKHECNVARMLLNIFKIHFS